MRHLLCLLALLLVLPGEARMIRSCTRPAYESDAPPLLPANDPFTEPVESRGFDPWQSTDEITLSIGMFMPTRGEEGGAQESYRLDYASFGYNNLGYRVGALFPLSYEASRAASVSRYSSSGGPGSGDANAGVRACPTP